MSNDRKPRDIRLAILQLQAHGLRPGELPLSGRVLDFKKTADTPKVPGTPAHSVKVLRGKEAQEFQKKANKKRKKFSQRLEERILKRRQTQQAKKDAT